MKEKGKIVKIGPEVRDHLLKGVDGLANAVKVTLGPMGRTVLLQKHMRPSVMTKDGVSVAKAIHFSDPLVNMGAEMVLQAASRTGDLAGDGTTTSTILAQNIYREGLKSLHSGVNPMDLKRGLDQACDLVVAYLEHESKDCKDRESLIKIGTVSANSDVEIGTIIVDAMEKVGEDGVIAVDHNISTETELEVLDGITFYRPYLSPYFINNPSKNTVEFKNPLIAIIDKEIRTLVEIQGILQMALQAQRPVLFIVNEIDNNALALLVVNKAKGIVQSCAVKAPEFGNLKTDMLEDIAIATGGHVLSENTGKEARDFTEEYFGSADKVIVSKELTTIICGHGDPEEIERRRMGLREEIKSTNSDFDRQKLKKRLAKLSDGVAVIKVGAATEIELKEKADRVDDAVHATQAAQKEGMLDGGGVALLRATKALDSIDTEGNLDRLRGIEILRKALEAPFRQIFENAGRESSIFVDKVLNGEPGTGFDLSTGEFGQLKELGIIDPTLVVRSALVNAVSVAGMLLTTEALVVEEPDEIS